MGVNRFCVVVWGPETRSGDGTAGERGDGNGRQGAVLWADEDVVAVEGAGRVVRCEESEDAADERVEDAPPWWSVIRWVLSLRLARAVGHPGRR